MRQQVSLHRQQAEELQLLASSVAAGASKLYQLIENQKLAMTSMEAIVDETASLIMSDSSSPSPPSSPEPIRCPTPPSSPNLPLVPHPTRCPSPSPFSSPSRKVETFLSGPLPPKLEGIPGIGGCYARKIKASGIDGPKSLLGYYLASPDQFPQSVIVDKCGLPARTGFTIADAFFQFVAQQI